MYALLLVGAIVFIMSLTGSYDPILYISYILFGVTIVVSLLGSVAGMLAKPSSIKSTFIGVGVMALVFIVSYAMADGSDYTMYANDITESTSKLSEMSLISLYVLSAGAILSLVASWVIKITR